MDRHVLLIALDSVGIDPLGHARPESVYAESHFLFPRQEQGPLLFLRQGPVPGILVETDVTADQQFGAIECALTYTSLFSGQSAVRQHGLMRGLGMNEKLFRDLIAKDNLFKHFASPCLANAIFPLHFPFLGSSYVQDLVPALDRQGVEERYHFENQPVRLRGTDKHGFAELFTLAEINQNIFVHAAREAGMTLATWDDVRRRQALTSSMTNELESRFNFFGLDALPLWTLWDAAEILASQAERHDFTFYKYQLSDLISHTGRIDLARGTFAIIEVFLERVLESIDFARTSVIVTSDHGHLEQVGTSHTHPKTKVPTWYFGPDLEGTADKLQRPEDIFQFIASVSKKEATDSLR